jgi:hypothetical protein
MAEAASPPPVVEPAPERVEDSVTVQYSSVHYQMSVIAFDYGTVGIVNRVSLPVGLAASIGGRIGFGEVLRPTPIFEGFANILLEPRLRTLTDGKGRHGVWRPSAGLEFGVTMAEHRLSGEPEAELYLEQPPHFYGAFVANPARFRVDALAVSVLGFVFGTSVDDFGRVLRLQVNAVELGVAF